MSKDLKLRVFTFKFIEPAGISIDVVYPEEYAFTDTELEQIVLAANLEMAKILRMK